jgi:CRISPR-associated protein Cmr3
MSTLLQVIPHDPVIARDGRPFGVGQGNRMRGLPWLLPSVVAGAFRTTLVKASPGLDFAGNSPQELMKIAVAGAFPTHGQKLYLPAPNDCVAEPNSDGKTTKTIHRVIPEEDDSGGSDLPEGLKPVMLPAQDKDGKDIADFKPAEIPAWWPVDKYVDWLLRDKSKTIQFDDSFLKSPVQEIRDHVKLDPALGAAEESQLFSTTGLNISHLPRFDAKGAGKFEERFAEVLLNVRVNDGKSSLKLGNDLNLWQPLGGERRLVHWRQQSGEITGWSCPDPIRNALKTTTKVRMILATPAIFKQGWKPDLEHGPLKDCGLTLVGASVGRWKAVSGWSLAPPRGPKAIRRMAPAGSVYFFEVRPGAAETLADKWLESVSDNQQEQHDGFGLAIWGTW